MESLIAFKGVDSSVCCSCSASVMGHVLGTLVVAPLRRLSRLVASWVCRAADGVSYQPWKRTLGQTLSSCERCEGEVESRVTTGSTSHQS